MKHLFKSLIVKTVKAPVLQQEVPKVPKKDCPKEYVDENAWLYHAFHSMIANLEHAIEPLEAYL